MTRVAAAARWWWLFCIALVAMPGVAASDPPVVSDRIVVTYFHTTQRCASCKKIEAYTTEAVQKAFAAEIEKGRVIWRLVNTDEKENKHFVKDYQLYTKSVVVSEEINGKQERWKNLPKIWELLGDKPAFLFYVREETEAYLAELP
jgi:thiol-disulfide isomerase/thioredoxin